MARYTTANGRTYRSELVVTGLGEDQGTSVQIKVRETYGSYLRRLCVALFRWGHYYG